MAWQGARLRPSRYSASGGSRRPQRKIEHRSLPPASIAASDSVRTERKGERRPLAPRRSGMSPNASHRVRPGLSSAASLITTLLISFDQEVLNQHLNLVTPEYPFFESPCLRGIQPFVRHRHRDQDRGLGREAEGGQGLVCVPLPRGGEAHLAFSLSRGHPAAEPIEIVPRGLLVGSNHEQLAETARTLTR